MEVPPRGPPHQCSTAPMVAARGACYSHGMLSPHQSQAREADRVANHICKRRLMNASLAAGAAWLTYVNPFTLEVREAGWPWLATVVAVSVLAMGYTLWAVTAGDRRAWMRAFHAATRKPLGSTPGESR